MRCFCRSGVFGDICRKHFISFCQLRIAEAVDDDAAHFARTELRQGFQRLLRRQFGKLASCGEPEAIRSPARFPAIAEELPGFEMVGWSGLMAPTGRPAAIINATNRDIVQIPGSAELKQKRSADAADGPQFTPEQFRDTISREIDRISRLVKEIGLKLE